MQTSAMMRFIFAFCLHMWRFVSRADLWKVFACAARLDALSSSTSVFSRLLSITSTFSCITALTPSTCICTSLILPLSCGMVAACDERVDYEADERQRPAREPPA